MLIITLKDILSLIWIIAVLVCFAVIAISEKLKDRKNKKKRNYKWKK